MASQIRKIRRRMEREQGIRLPKSAPTVVVPTQEHTLDKLSGSWVRQRINRIFRTDGGN